MAAEDPVVKTFTGKLSTTGAGPSILITIPVATSNSTATIVAYINGYKPSTDDTESKIVALIGRNVAGVVTASAVVVMGSPQIGGLGIIVDTSISGTNLRVRISDGAGVFTKVYTGYAEVTYNLGS